MAQQPSSSPSAPVYTIEQIRQQRMAKKTEIATSVRRMQTFSEQLFAPQRSIGKLDGLMQQVNAGIAAYDGLMTGLRIMRRVQSFFRHRRR